MFGVNFLNPYVLMICNAGFSPDLTSLSHAPARGYGLRIVTTRANSKRFKRLRRRGTLVASPCPARSTRCHPKHGLVPSPGGRGRASPPRADPRAAPVMNYLRLPEFFRPPLRLSDQRVAGSPVDAGSRR